MCPPVRPVCSQPDEELIMKREMEELSDEEFREEYSEVIADGSD